ncbi:hypothetical protein OMAG_001758 [Candidatus Omnitrophus magneticus]|uniref:Uncharacterized protein n=1 Tax=Candidatus Omnitrophus magneticus TaxID=1609969 RepID=A0A0F0CS82_9BACT|nr:hypothetical protein OMAG_001758 [Candidatus Omnitrophus magneticus]
MNIKNMDLLFYEEGASSGSAPAPSQDKDILIKRVIFDENTEINDGEKLPVHDSIKLIRYRTIKKNSGLGWWSAIVLLEDHKRREICFYRWKKRNKEWKRDKKLHIRSKQEWNSLKEAVEPFLNELG